MHDPEFVLFQVRRPWPKVRHTKHPRHGRRLSFPFVRLGRWEAYFPGVVTVWHHEPNGGDSGSVCKHRFGSGLSLRTLAWGWKHRRHLRLQVSPWQTLCRRIFTRCTECGQPFRRRQMVIGHGWNGDGPGWRCKEVVFHDKCSALSRVRGQADERLWMVAMLMDVSGLDEKTLRTVAELRSDDRQGWNKAWRVLYDLSNSPHALHAEARP